MSTPTLEDVRRALTPTMRFALGTCADRPGADMRGLYHGTTLNALVRHGLARHERGWGVDDHVTVLTDFGRIIREDLRNRVDTALAALGYVRVEGQGSLYRVPEVGGGTVTRAGAMRRTGVQW